MIYQQIIYMLYKTESIQN